MRVRSIIFFLIIIGLIGGGGYFLYTNWGLVQGMFLTVSGYTPAEKPEDAMDLFAKAIENREYNAAARYVTDDYAEYLKKGKTAASDLASYTDSLARLSQDRGLNSPRALYVLRCLDPFPGGFKRRSSEKLVKQEDGSYTGRFVADYSLPSVDLSNIQNLDVHMFRNAMMPPMPNHVPAFNFLVKIIPIEKDGSKIYKLEIPLDPMTKEEINHMITNYKKYRNSLSHLCSDVRASGSYDSPKAFADDLIATLGKLN